MSPSNRESKGNNAVPSDRLPPQPGGTRQRVPEADGYKVVCVRLRTAEFDQFASDVKAAGLTNSMALRIAARRVGGFLEIDGKVRHDLEELLRAIGALSQAVRDLHDACLTGGTVTAEQLDVHRTVFGSAFSQLDGMLRSILNISRRRADGRSLLAGAATR